MLPLLNDSNLTALEILVFLVKTPKLTHFLLLILRWAIILIAIIKVASSGINQTKINKMVFIVSPEVS